MSGGISKNPLTDISQLYLDTVAKVKDAEVKQDIERWGQTQKESQDPTANKPKAPQFNAAKELVQKAPYMKPALQQSHEGFSSWRAEMREVVDQDVAAFLDRPETEKKAEKEVVEKKVKNKVVINPTLSDAVELLGGKLIEVKVSEEKKVVKKEVTALQKAAKTLRGKFVAKADKIEEGLVNEGPLAAAGGIVGGLAGGALAGGGALIGGAVKGASSVAAATRAAASQQAAVTKRNQARQKKADQDAANIEAGVQEEIEAAVEYFYEEGINEEGLDLIIEEVGLDDFVDFVSDTEFLTEERAARRATVRAKSYADVKAAVDKSDAAKKKAKKGEYAPSYAKKETDVTDYDEAPKPVAKKAPAGMKKAVARKKEVLKQPVKKVAPKPVAKKVQKAVAKVKPAQPKKPASKQGLRDKITTAYKAGVKRHKKAVQPARVFAKGMKAGAKSAVKFAGKAKKALVGEKYDPMDDPDFDPVEAEKNRGVSGKNNPKGGKKLKDIVKESGWHRRNPDKVGTPADPDFNVLKGKGKPVKDSKPSTTGKASKQPPGIYKPNKEGKFVKVDEAKVDTGSAEAKASARNVRNTPAGKDSKFDTSVFITRKPGESLDSARTRKRREAHAKKRGVKEDKAFDNVVAALRKKHGEAGVLTKDSPKPKAKPLNAKQIWKRDNRDAIQREVDAQYGRTPWNKKGSLGT